MVPKLNVFQWIHIISDIKKWLSFFLQSTYYTNLETHNIWNQIQYKLCKGFLNLDTSYLKSLKHLIDDISMIDSISSTYRVR